MTSQTVTTICGVFSTQSGEADSTCYSISTHASLNRAEIAALQATIKPLERDLEILQRQEDKLR